MAQVHTVSDVGHNDTKGDQDDLFLDRELEQLPADLRRRTWMMRIEAVLFAAAVPLSRATLARVIGRDCSVDALVDDLVLELRDRPYELMAVAGGWQLRTRPHYAPVIRAASTPTRSVTPTLSDFETALVTAIAYLQPVTRSELSDLFGKAISRDAIARLRGAGFITSGPRSPTPGAPYSYVTTKQFLSAFNLQTLRDLPDAEALEDAGLLSPKSGTEID